MVMVEVAIMMMTMILMMMMTKLEVIGEMTKTVAAAVAAVMMALASEGVGKGPMKEERACQPCSPHRWLRPFSSGPSSYGYPS